MSPKDIDLTDSFSTIEIIIPVISATSIYVNTSPFGVDD